jgi:hypothetical protein
MPPTVAAADDGEPGLGHVLLNGRTHWLGNEAYRWAFFEFGYTFDVPFGGAGFVSGLRYRENRGPVVNALVAAVSWVLSLLPVSNRTTVASGVGYTNGVVYQYEVTRAATADEMESRLAGQAALRGFAPFHQRWLSMDLRVFDWRLGSSRQGVDVSTTVPIWIDAWGGGVVLEPGLNFGGLGTVRRGGVGPPDFEDMRAYFALSFALRIPIIRAVGTYAAGAFQFAEPYVRFVDAGVEANVFNRFSVRTYYRLEALPREGETPMALPESIWSSIRFDLGVRL